MRVVACVCLFAAPLSCLAKKKPTEAYGLMRVDVTIDGENMAKLNSTVWAKVPVGGHVTIGGREFAADISYSGKSTIDAFKKSFEVSFKNGDRFRGRSGYRIYAAIMDSSGVKSAVGFKAFELAGLPAPRMEPVAVFVNGTYAGLFSLLEPVDREFLEVRGVAVKNLVKMQYGNAGFGEENLLDTEAAFDVKGDPEFLGDIRSLVQLVQAPASEANMNQMGERIDLDVFFRYVAASVVLNNWDGFRNNAFFYRERHGLAFKVVPWDLDRLYDETAGHEVYRAGVDLYGHGYLCEKLMSYPALRARYHEVLRDTLARVLTFETLTASIDTESARLTEAFAADPVLSAEGRTAAGEAEALKKAAKSWIDQLAQDLKGQP